MKLIDPNVNKLIDAFEKVSGYRLEAEVYDSALHTMNHWASGELKTKSLTISWIWEKGCLLVTLEKR